jgi:hypothetical protein
MLQETNETFFEETIFFETNGLSFLKRMGWFLKMNRNFVFVSLFPEKVTFSHERMTFTILKVTFSDERVTFSALKVVFSYINIRINMHFRSQ